MKIYIGGDHAAFETKEHLKKIYRLEDCGSFSPESCDYPDYAHAVAKLVQKGLGKGVLLCGSGIGVSMVANRYALVRAALCRTPEEARLSVAHNDSNILCMGVRNLDLKTIEEIFTAWTKASFEGGRHQRRIDKFNQLGQPPAK